MTTHRNYCLLSATFPDGTLIADCNFSQANPDTVAILGKNLTFRDCNLVNVRLDPSWTIECCNIAKIIRKVEAAVSKDGLVAMDISIYACPPGKTKYEKTGDDACTVAEQDVVKALRWITDAKIADQISVEA